MKRPKKITITVFTLLAFLPFAAHAQDQSYEAPPPDAAMAAPPPGTPAPQTFTQQQIDQLTAPIALYPDPLVGQILMASTYPLEVVEASRWLQSGGNAQLGGDQLAAALAQQPWDPSVKSLVAFPQVLSMLDGNLQWTEQLGDAFLGNQAAVSNSVQRLRSMAQASGNLASTPQQTVSGAPGDLMIEPASPELVYVPTYNPMVVYGAWPYAGYPPYYFPPPPGFVDFQVGLIGFSVGFGIVDALWGWDRWDWRDHRIDIDDGRFEAINGGRAPSFEGGVWEHDPAHRHGVPYRTPAARAQFQGAANAARGDYRGYGTANTSVRPAATRASAVRPSVTSSVAARPAARPAEEAGTYTPPRQQQTAAPRPQFRAQPQAQQQAAPVFESFARGADVRAQSQRGAVSRASAPAAQPQRQQQVQHSAPSNGGSRGGGNNSNDGRNR